MEQRLTHRRRADEVEDQQPPLAEEPVVHKGYKRRHDKDHDASIVNPPYVLCDVHLIKRGEGNQGSSSVCGLDFMFEVDPCVHHRHVNIQWRDFHFVTPNIWET